VRVCKEFLSQKRGGRMRHRHRTLEYCVPLHGVEEKEPTGVVGEMQAKKLRDWGADGVIVGSALVSVLGEASDPKAGLESMTQLARSIRAALD
jgi:tryptophan synthase alpha chain